MPNNLRDQLSSLASSFTDGVLAAIRSASLEDLLNESGRRPARGRAAGAPAKSNGRLQRRSAADIQAALGKVLGLLKGKKGGLRSEQIRAVLKFDKRELPRVLHEGLKAKKLKAKGQKRATVYSAN